MNKPIGGIDPYHEEVSDMKEALVLLYLMAVVITTAGCLNAAGNTQKTVMADPQASTTPGGLSSSVQRNFDEALVISPVIVAAEYVGKETGKVNKHNFKLVDELKGHVTEDSFLVQASNVQFEERKRYILVLALVSFVYLDRDRYDILNNLVMELDSNDNIVKSADGLVGNKTFQTKAQFKEYLDNTLRENTKYKDASAIAGSPVFRKKDAKVMAEQTPYMIEATLDEIVRSTELATVYRCTVDKVYKGDIGGKISVLIPTDMKAVLGRKYFLLVDVYEKIDDRIEYTINSRFSMVPVEDKAGCEEFLAYLR